jgi:two-component system CheB/CheR fusion protein
MNVSSTGVVRLVGLPAPWRYGLATGAAVAAVALRWALLPLLGTNSPYLSLFPAVLAVAILLGPGAALAASGLGAVLTEIWLVPHPVGAVIVPAADWLRIAVVAGSALLIGGITRRLRAAEAALVESDRRKDEFLALLSHELRNPLGTIRSALSILAQARAPTAEETTRVRTAIERQLSHLSRLVDDLLDVSRIKTGKMRLERRSLDFTALARRTVEDHLALFAANGLSVDVRLPDTALWMNGDPTRLAQVVGNLLQNASKFTPPGGRVLVTVEGDGIGAHLRVRDNGLGLDTAARARLFQPFVQADTAAHRTRGGLGIGLALVKVLVDLHEGRVEAISEGAGKGSEFHVVLPLDRERKRKPPARHAEEGAGRVVPRQRVLIIEDNHDFAAMLQVLLQLTGGHEVYVADSGPKGLDLALRMRPDVVVCDIGLPVMDGYEVARALRSQPATRDALLIALTGYASLDDTKRATEAGFNHHLAKGGDPEAVVRLLEQRPA